jgi:hypothetical protein
MSKKSTQPNACDELAYMFLRSSWREFSRITGILSSRIDIYTVYKLAPSTRTLFCDRFGANSPESQVFFPVESTSTPSISLRRAHVHFFAIDLARILQNHRYSFQSNQHLHCPTTISRACTHRMFNTSSKSDVDSYAHLSKVKWIF